MRIGLDVDGVLYQWSATARKILKRKHGLEIGESQTWNWIKDHTPAEFWKRLWDEDIEEMYIGGEYYPGAREAVAHLVGLGWEVFMITATPDKVRKLRGQRLLEDFAGISGVNFVPTLSIDKTHIRCDVYLDDKPETTVATADAGFKSLLQDRPWNQHANDPRVVRIFGWEQLVQEVEK